MIGDTFTFEGVRERIPNRNRRWWQFWKPRFFEGINLARFVVTGEYVVPVKMWSPVDMREIDA